MFRRSSKESRIVKDTRKLLITDSSVHNASSDQERMANLMQIEDSLGFKSNRGIFFDWFSDEVAADRMNFSLAVVGQENTSFRFQIPHKSSMHYFTISYLCILWQSTIPKSNASMSLYIKDETYTEESAQRDHIAKFPLNKMACAMYRMSNYRAISDQETMSLYINITDLDVKNKNIGDLKLFYIVRYSNEPVLYAYLKPAVRIFGHHMHDDDGKPMIEALTQELALTFKKKNYIFNSNFQKKLESLGKLDSDDDYNLEDDIKAINLKDKDLKDSASNFPGISKALTYRKPNN